MLKFILVIAIILIGVTMIFLVATGFFSETNKEEKYNTSSCENESCIMALCGECQYIENATCFKYECCNNSGCNGNKSCQDHKCQEIVCGACQYKANQLCYNYTCCADSYCNDNNVSTVDKCIRPNSTNSSCEHLVYECLANSDCDDDNSSTQDICLVSTKKCSHDWIDECDDDDNYCPEDCNYTNDDDCSPIGDLFLQNISWTNYSTYYTIKIGIRKDNSSMPAGYPILHWKLYINDTETTDFLTNYEVTMGGVDILTNVTEIGQYKIHIIIDPNNDILETNENNNDETQIIDII